MKVFETANDESKEDVSKCDNVSFFIRKLLKFLI